MLDIKKIKQLPIHFILCTERTGSSLLNSILNQSPEILATSEELFALYLYPKYHQKVTYTEKEIKELVHDFVYLSEKNLKMFFSDINVFEKNLLAHKEYLPYPTLLRLIYWHFFDVKDKSNLKVFVDKQIKYLYYIKDVLKIFPDSKYIILTRDVRDNVLIRKKRNLHNTSDIVYMAGIWNDTYKNVQYLFEKIPKEKILVVHYEDLILQTEKTIQNICQFLEVKFFPEMLNFQENYKKFIEYKRPIVGEDYYQRMIDFHSGLLKPISKDKIGLWKKELNEIQLKKIATICGKTAQYLNYDLYEYGTAPLSISDKWQLLKASLKRYWFLKLYLKIPTSIKILIKKVRGKRMVEA
jgi:hypothetical protein